MSAQTNVIAAFDEDHAIRLSGVTKSQLRYWVRSDFFAPSFSDTSHKAFARVYSFNDIVELKVLNMLRNTFRVSLPHLRAVKEKLGSRPWSGVKLFVHKRSVAWVEPKSAKHQEIASGQYIVPVALDEIVNATKGELARMKERDKSTVGKILKSRFVNHNAAVIAGTRIRVSAVKAFSEAGYTPAQIVREYPDLTKDDVKAALAYKDERAAA
ncbi:MAG: DUF433 domain-containing protein [Arenimonas sp.]|jgi:uncharacterized protein (DUF433 family)